VLRRLAAMPGQRSMVLVSPGFLTVTHHNQVDALVNRALQQNIVINAIDAAGLYTRISHSWLAGSRLDLDAKKTGIQNEKLKVARDVLAGLSAGTGGVYFQNSSDFNEGFREAAQAPGCLLRAQLFTAKRQAGRDNPSAQGGSRYPREVASGSATRVCRSHGNTARGGSNRD
jgi:hypothetical protein